MVNHIHHWPSPSGVVWFSRPAGTWGPGCRLCRNRKRNQPTGHKLDINSTPSPNLLKYQGQRHPSPTPISHAASYEARHQTQNSIQTTFSASDGSSKLRRARVGGTTVLRGVGRVSMRGSEDQKYFCAAGIFTDVENVGVSVHFKKAARSARSLSHQTLFTPVGSKRGHGVEGSANSSGE